MVSGTIISWQINGEKVKTVTDRFFIFLGSKITADGDCSHEIKRHLLLGRKTTTNQDSVFKAETSLCQQRSYTQSYGFSSIMHGCESYNIMKAKHQKLILLNCGAGEDSFESPLDRKSNQSILKETNSEYSLEGLMLKLKLQYFDHLMQTAKLLEKKPWFWERMRAGREVGDGGWDGWMVSLTQWTWVWANSGRWWRTRNLDVLHSMGLQRVGNYLVIEQQKSYLARIDLCPVYFHVGMVSLSFSFRIRW